MEKLRNKIPPILNFVILTAFLLALLCLLKYFVLDVILNSSLQYESKLFTLTPVFNTGAAFSILTSHTQLLVYLSFIVLAGVAFWVVYYAQTLSKPEIVAVSMLFSGVMLNLYERVTLGYVIDYIKLNFVSFPIFNFSDVAIVSGAILYIIILYSKRD